MKFIAITIALITAVSALSHLGNYFERRSICDGAGEACDPDYFPLCCSSQQLAQCVVEDEDIGPVLQVRTRPLGCGTDDDGDDDCVRNE
jgi:hypothetical protein